MKATWTRFDDSTFQYKHLGINEVCLTFLEQLIKTNL